MQIQPGASLLRWRAVRREHHPFWVQRIVNQASLRWAEHFLVPQFDAVGKEPRFAGARYIVLIGPNIRVGDHFHAYGAPHAPVSLAVNPYDGGNGEGEIVFGDYCVVSTGARIRSALSVHIGDNTMLAENCFITDADWHDSYHRIFPGKRAPVRIGNNVWLGDSVTVCKGVTIGDNAIIGARSVVTRDIPANTIAAGNPAKPIAELDPAQPGSRREHLFAPGGLPYDDFKALHDRQRLGSNTLAAWLRTLVWPGKHD
jgi:acetyltransferase-like isoleucine patch superfamily enzyme